MITRTKKYLVKLIRHLYWRYEEDLLWVAGIIFLAWIFAHAYPIDPNMPL